MSLLRTIYLDGLPLRIFVSPLDVPDHPWASFEDLVAVINMHVDDRSRWLVKLQHELPDMLHRSADGTVIVAEPLVAGTFMALDMMGRSDARDLLDDWTDAWMELFALQLAKLPEGEWQPAVHKAELRNTPRVCSSTVLH